MLIIKKARLILKRLAKVIIKDSIISQEKEISTEILYN